MTVPRISAVLPIKIVGRHWGENLARTDILLASLSHYAAADLFQDIFVVVPAREQVRIRASLAYWSGLPLTVICEDDILPEFQQFGRVAGWFRQQLIKLYIANLSATEFFLTLDPDVILSKKMTFDSLVIGGKGILELEERAPQARWWRGSARVLGLPVDLTAPGMSVTPALLSRTICQLLFEDLRAAHRSEWTVALLSLSHLFWTEYSLYYLTAERHGMLETFHTIPGAGDTRLLCESNVWHRGKFAAWDVAASFGPGDPGLFSVVQSNARVPAADVARRLAGYFRAGRDLAPSRLIKLRSLTEDFLRVTFGRV